VIARNERSSHEQAWLELPWLANGRLAAAERARVEDHVQGCEECQRELAAQRRLCAALGEPDRVVYAPGPSFRKLLDRIDGVEPQRERSRPGAGQPLLARLSHVSLWRPPGLAWAASFILLFAVTGLVITSYRWSEPVFRTRSDPAAITANVLHIALDRSLTIGEVEEMLRTNGARIIEGPANAGILGVSPIGLMPGQTPQADADRQLRSLAARLRADSRVLWIQPLQPLAGGEGTPTGGSAPAAQDH
jgi:Putative zinc-finger